MPKSYLANKITTAKKITHRDLRGRCRTKKKGIKLVAKYMG